MPGSLDVTDGQTECGEWGPTGCRVPARPRTGGTAWSVSRPPSGVAHGICVAVLWGGTALGWGATGLTCGSSGPQHSPPQPPSSVPPTGAAWSRGPCLSWARPEGERTEGEGRGRSHTGTRSPAQGCRLGEIQAHTLCWAGTSTPQVCWAPLGILGRWACPDAPQPLYNTRSIYPRRYTRAETGFIGFTTSRTMKSLLNLKLPPSTNTQALLIWAPLERAVCRLPDAFLCSCGQGVPNILFLRAEVINCPKITWHGE